MDLKVFITNQDSTCDECREKLGHHAWITLADNKAFCLSCADLNHLIFLPSGDAALTRRSAKYSTLFAVVLKWSRARKHYERQGLLVEESALQRAEYVLSLMILRETQRSFTLPCVSQTFKLLDCPNRKIEMGAFHFS